MDLVDWLITGTFTGAFLYGIWYMLIRNDDRSMRSRTLEADAIRSTRTSPNFSKARSEFERKLAEVIRRRDDIKAREQAQKESAEEIAKIKVEEEERPRRRGSTKASRIRSQKGSRFGSSKINCRARRRGTPSGRGSFSR
ncbi:MAG: hypothetical protein CXT71_02545 [Methanobacteriota archaeon]|nr:MAG: hypothetical protein CXT71_02545 [Euryarchaeota archaeon]